MYEHGQQRHSERWPKDVWICSWLDLTRSPSRAPPFQREDCSISCANSRGLCGPGSQHRQVFAESHHLRFAVLPFRSGTGAGVSHFSVLAKTSTGFPPDQDSPTSPAPALNPWQPRSFTKETNSRGTSKIFCYHTSLITQTFLQDNLKLTSLIGIQLTN